jgi:hypothetical protein
MQNPNLVYSKCTADSYDQGRVDAYLLSVGARHLEVCSVRRDLEYSLGNSN